MDEFFHRIYWPHYPIFVEQKWEGNLKKIILNDDHHAVT